MDLIQSPSEEYIEFQFKGLFNPQNFDTSWLIRNEIFDEKETKAFTDINSREGYMSYSTELMRFTILPKQFKISTNSLSTFNLLFETCKLITSVVRKDFREEVNLKIQYHFKLESHSKVKAGLRKLINLDSLQKDFNNQLLEEGVNFLFRSNQKDFSLYQDVYISKCYRMESNKEFHIYINNGIKLKSIIMFKNFDSGIKRIFENTEKVVNNILKAYFC